MRAVGRLLAGNRTSTAIASGGGWVVLSFAQRVTALRGSAAVGIAQIKGHPTNFVFHQGQVLSADKMSYGLAAAAADLAVASRWRSSYARWAMSLRCS